MKTRKNTIEAQQICLEAAKEVLNCLEIAFTDMEHKGLFREEPELCLLPYNQGYQIRIDININMEVIYERQMTENFPSFFRSINIQPASFFEAYFKEKNEAHLEYSHLFEDEKGCTTGRVGVINMNQVQCFAKKWVELIKKEIESL